MHMDCYRVSAKAVHKDGASGVFSIVVRERDSEVIPEDQKKLMWFFMAGNAEVEIAGPITIELIDCDMARRQPVMPATKEGN